MHTFDIALSLIAQVDPVDAGAKLGDTLQKGGLGAVAALFIITSVVLYRAKEKKAEACEAEVRALHVAHSKALQDVAEKSRANEEAKNEKLVAMTGKLVEVVAANTTALDRLTDAVDKLDAKRGG